MPARLRLADHLSHDEIFARYRAAQRPIARSHWQVLWMLSQDFRTEDSPDAIGYSPIWIRSLSVATTSRDPRRWATGGATTLGRSRCSRMRTRRP